MGNNYSHIFENLTFIGTLMFHEFPSTCVFQDKSGNPWIQEWINVTDEGVDQYIIFCTTKRELEKFINGKLSHLNFITKNQCIYFERNIENPQNIQEILKFPVKYLPSEDVYFDITEGVDSDVVNNKFALCKY